MVTAQRDPIKKNLRSLYREFCSCEEPPIIFSSRCGVTVAPLTATGTRTDDLILPQKTPAPKTGRIMGTLTLAINENRPVSERGERRNGAASGGRKFASKKRAKPLDGAGR
ncbi:hypothetical protein [Marivita sp. GX14005]|uniref:hypothetical protein n=1 Tax=Marivita sp. GX14005 TaxID=2942276 RepID=UPI002018E30C|nr:hypothetical protein [Marivita sp. GX14005]MCL3883588.1 hypothetical protein [Marivita sp. GX14005]